MQLTNTVINMLTTYLVILLNLIPSRMGEEDNTCPEGFSYQPGNLDIPGDLGQEGVSSLADCVSLCQDDDTCCSVSYSADQQLCNINTGYRVTRILIQDYSLCTRQSQSKEQAGAELGQAHIIVKVKFGYRMKWLKHLKCSC